MLLRHRKNNGALHARTVDIPRGRDQNLDLGVDVRHVEKVDAAGEVERGDGDVTLPHSWFSGFGSTSGFSWVFGLGFWGSGFFQCLVLGFVVERMLVERCPHGD
jgi:hypothetical protein